MKVNGFIGPAYSLDSVNVDHQRCVNLYPEKIESGTGKGGSVAYLKTTPGLIEAVTVGDGPIRCIHTDLIGRNFVVSGNQVFTIKNDLSWKLVPASFDEIDDIDQSSDVSTSTDAISSTDHGYETGLKVQVSSSNTLPTGLSASTDYWVIKSDDNSFQLATSLANAIAGTEIDITGAGSGTLTVTPQIPPTVTFSQSAIDPDTDTIAASSHNLYEGLKVKVPTVGENSGGIDPGTYYYVIKTDDDTFQLSTSPANAIAGTEIDITEPSGTWTTTLLGSRGESGGDAVTLLTSSGVVKAASMSQLGEGQDSSTFFVDGTNNYLYLQTSTGETFGISGEQDTAEVTFDLTGSDDITVYAVDKKDDYLGDTVRLKYDDDLEDDFYDVYLLLTVLKPPGETADSVIHISVNSDTTSSLTTKDVAEIINDPIAWASANGKEIDVRSGGTGDNPNNMLQVNAFGGGTSLAKDEIGSTGLTETFSTGKISGGEFGSVPSATDIVWIDGYFIVNKGGTNKFFVSDLLGFEIDSLDFSSSEGKHDVIVALMDRERELWVFNELSTEVFFNTGNEIFPFERVGSGYIEIGCLAKRSVAKIDSTVFWLGQTESGKGTVYAASSTRPQRISTHAIEQAIRSYENPEAAVAWTYSEAGHQFYVLNFSEATWVYDLSTGLWHERAYTNSGDLERHRVNTHSYDFKRGLHLCGDYESNQIYLLDEETFTDGDTEITRLRTSPHLSESDSLNRIICDRFQLDMETGVGLSSGQGSDPQVMLQWSDDGGHTWSSESWTSAGGQVGGVGEYKKRVSWRRLGVFRDRIWRVQITDPVKVNIIAAHMDVRVLGS